MPLGQRRRPQNLCAEPAVSAAAAVLRAVGWGKARRPGRQRVRGVSGLGGEKVTSPKGAAVKTRKICMM